MPSISSPIGELAKALCDRRADMRIVIREVNDLLCSLFEGWNPLFPLERCWQFVEPSTLHVFHAIDSPAARGGLALAGFLTVVVHPHDAGADAMEACRCAPKEMLI